MELSKEKLLEINRSSRKKLDEYKASGVSYDLTRGKPGKRQLDLTTGMLDVISNAEDCFSESGLDCRNYGILDGLPETKRLFSELLGIPASRIMVGGNSSLNLMYDTMARAMLYGVLGSERPWCREDEVIFLCPSPGYDRHFAICQSLGIKMIPIEMKDDGPDMDEVERLAASDPHVKGIWCVPKFSNPDGITYSDETVRRFAALKTAAPDFRIFWDNAYCVHHLFDDAAEQDQLLDIAATCREAGTEDRCFKFASTSKVTLPGAGIAAFAASPDNVGWFKRHLGITTVGPDKLNQLRHVRFLKDAEGIDAHMRKHAAILRPKFDLVARKLEEGLSEVGGCAWSSPRGGYFVSFDAPEGCASRIVELAREAGVVMTDAGATWPYGKDPHDSNIRIAPTLPPLSELDEALDVFVCCVKLAYVEKLLG